MGVISNEIKSTDSKSKLFFAELADKAYESYKEPYDVGCKYTEKELALQSYFKEKALKDYVTMHILDVACGNTDRHDLNFFVDVVKDDNNLPVIQGIRLFDYGHGGMAYSNLFVNGLGNGRLKNKAEMIEEFKTNEYVNMFYTPTEMSEMLGNIDVVETARDVKETINYEIDDGLVTKFARLIDDTAESLIK